MKNELKVIVLLFSVVLAQDRDTPLKSSPLVDYQISSQRYITNTDGNIMMNVNIWGAVGSPGSHIVYDGIDFASLLSIVGGPIGGANLKEVRIYREIPDEDGALVYYTDLTEFVLVDDFFKSRRGRVESIGPIFQSVCPDKSVE